MNAKRRPLIAGNWKMHHGGATGIELAAACVKISNHTPHVDLLIAPPYTALAAAAHMCEWSTVELAAQNIHAKNSGAYTGEISAPMLVEAGCKWVIVGHSERRQYYGENFAIVHDKTCAAIDNGLKPIVCVGETLEEREAGKTLEIVKREVVAVLHVLAKSTIPVAIAYEPVWAIGTGKNAQPSDAEEVHAAIRNWLAGVSEDFAERTRILYGGSLKPENATSLLECPNVDGGLIGGASLDAKSFGAIATAAERLV
ncbi:MAG: triose-phosphate isomerase [Polyangiaceae bacterium]